MIRLSLRQLLSRKRQSVLTLLGIVLGAAAYVVISGMMLGFQGFLSQQLIENDGHLHISAREELILPGSLDDQMFPGAGVIHWFSPPSGRRDLARIEYPQGWFSKMDHDPRVVAYAQELILQALISRGTVSLSIKMVGVEPERQARVTRIAENMVEGKFADIGQSGNRLVLGDTLLKKLGARISETVFLTAGKGSAPVPFKIVGSFHMGITTLDEGSGYGAIADLQRLNGTPSQITDVVVKLTQPEIAREVSDEWSEFAVDKVQSWDQANASILSVFKTQDIVRNSMTISILLVSAFGIYNVLNMLVNQKRREIGILRSMGYEARDIILLFLNQGLILGALGGLIGALIGYLGCKYLATVEVDPARLGKGKLIVSFSPLIYLRAMGLAMIPALIASWLPARAASRLSPIEVIRTGME